MISSKCNLMLAWALASVVTSVSVAAAPKDVVVKNDESSPVPVTVQNDGEVIIRWQLVGVSEHVDDGSFEYNGRGGIPAMNKACADTFGAAAHAADLSEAMAGGAFPPAAGDPAWLVPRSTPAVTFARGTQFFVAKDAVYGVDVGDIREFEDTARSIAYCGAYGLGLNSFKGPTVNDSTRPFLLANCNRVLPVACAAPVAIPVP